MAIAFALDTIGDRWTLLVIRGMMIGRKTYGEFLDSKEKIATNIPADRLKFLEHAAIISKKTRLGKPAAQYLQPDKKACG